MRIVTWNVNGIRNPFQYQPWRDKKTFEGMFEVLEADIVVLQETKIQRKDLRDDMVLVPGWDCYWSLPKHKKGYSGVVIYTKNSVCAPIRAEEGVTGVLCPPNSKTTFRDLPDEQQIGGYPTVAQLSKSEVDAVTVDSEGRCVILEFPAFVLIGVYCPANRDESRDEFRLGFLDLLDARIRNLTKMGKRVFLTGDINISREELDTAAAEESMRKHGMTNVEYCSTPARRLFNQLLVGGKVFGERDEGRENSPLCDITREFHPTRKGMFTCWETKVNARPGNFGARIDYVLCSAQMKDWFSDSNIQEGLMGSDHCPVYATMKDEIQVGEVTRHALDVMNPPGMFRDGKRKREWTMKDMLPMSGKLIPEFDRRQSIRDMFKRKPSTPKESSAVEEVGIDTAVTRPVLEPPITFTPSASAAPTNTESRKENAPAQVPSPPKSALGKRAAKADTSLPPSKKTKSTPASNGTSSKGQQSLAGFFKPKSSAKPPADSSSNDDCVPKTTNKDDPTTTTITAVSPSRSLNGTTFQEPTSPNQSPNKPILIASSSPTATKQTWTSLLRRPVAPMCEHDEPCKTMLTKKPGVNCGRSFWMCNRPLGPSGQKEKGSQWRCGTFIWGSEWKGIEREESDKRMGKGG